MLHKHQLNQNFKRNNNSVMEQEQEEKLLSLLMILICQLLKSMVHNLRLKCLDF
jgi:hypothetical protein